MRSPYAGQPTRPYSAYAANPTASASATTRQRALERAARGASLIVHAVNPPGYRNWGQGVANPHFDLALHPHALRFGAA